MSGKSLKRDIAVIHFLPVELYPPLMNFVNCWKDPSRKNHLRIYTTPASRNSVPEFVPGNPSINIRRFGFDKPVFFVTRGLHYLLFFGQTFLNLLIRRPHVVFYFDTISSFPACLYKWLFGSSTRLFIHYHEYMSKKEYVDGMALLKWFHKMEMKLYQSADWISHTNWKRMELFEADIQQHIRQKHIIPNYPPANWAGGLPGAIQTPVKIVYVGALSMQTMYIKEFSKWVTDQQGQVLWDIYSQQEPDDVISYFKELQSPYIKFSGYCAYPDLPQKLRKYDVGVILYKGHIPNYIYNAPNKLFEYHVCGLDVWFPQQMSTAADYAKTHSYPKILPIHFEQLFEYSIYDLIQRNGLSYDICSFTAEAAFIELNDELNLESGIRNQ